MAWMRNNCNNNMQDSDHMDDDMSSSSMQNDANANHRHNVGLLQAALMERYDNLLRGLEEQERQQVAQRNAIFVDDSSSSSDDSGVDEDDEEVRTETMELARFFPMQEKGLSTYSLTDLPAKFESTFRLYCAKEDHIYVPAANSCIMQHCSVIEPENVFLRIQFRGRPRTVRFAQDYLRTTWLDRTIYFHNWNITQEHGRVVMLRDVPTPLGVHLIRVFEKSLDRSVGLVVEAHGGAHPTLRAVLHTASCAILMKTNGQPMEGTDDFQRVKGTATTIESLEFKCLAKDAIASQYLWHDKRIEKERNGSFPPPPTEAMQVDDSSSYKIGGDTHEVEKLAQSVGDEMDIDDASVGHGMVQEQNDEQPKAPRLQADKPNVQRPPGTPRCQTIPQQPKTIPIADVQIGASPDDYSHFRHFRSKLVGLCNEEYDKTGLLRGCYSSMFKQHRLRIGERCPIDCQCSYEIPFLAETVEKNQKEKGTTITYSPSGLLGVFAATMMPYIRQWYPDMQSIHHLNQLLPLWRFHVHKFGSVCREGCPCQSSIDLFRGVDYHPLTKNAVAVYSRSHFEFKCNPVMKEEFGDVVLTSILPRWWKQHQDLFGDLCNEQCPCASNMPRLLSRLLEDLKNDPKSPDLSSQTASMATLFFQRFIPKLTEEYPSDSPAMILGRLLEMWQIHKLHLRFGKVCRPACKCEGVWESLFEKGVRLGRFANTQAKACASINQQASSSPTTLARITAPNLATMLPQQPSPAINPSAAGHSKKRKAPPDTGSESHTGPPEDENSYQAPPENPADNSKKQRVGKVAELPDRRGVLEHATHEIDQLSHQQENSASSSRSAAFFGWESFKKKMLPVVTHEYGLTEIHPVAILSHIWKRHKEIWGAECNIDCPCMQNVPYLTETVAADMKKDPKWSHVNIPNYPVGFVGTFIPKFTPLLSEAFPEESPGKHLERLCSLWVMHTEQRNFGKTCSEDCECLAAWDIAFLPRLLSPENRIKRRRKSIEMQGEADKDDGAHVTPSTPREARNDRRESPGKNSPRERLPYEIAFDSVKPLGIYVVTEVKGHSPVCKVISYDPYSSNVDDRISLGTKALASRIEHHGWVAIHRHRELNREFARAREEASTLTIRFINTNVTERDVWTCNKYNRSDWDSTGRWVGKCRTGWDGHLPLLVQQAKEPVRPIQNNGLGDHDRNEFSHRHGDHQKTTGVRFAKQIESVRVYSPHSFVFADHGPLGETPSMPRVSAATFDSFEDEVRSVVLHWTPHDAFLFFQCKKVVTKLKEMKTKETSEFGESVKQAVRNTRDEDGAIDLKYRAFKICLHTVRSLRESKILKSWERFHLTLRRIHVKSLPPGYDWHDKESQHRTLKVELLFKKKGENPHADGASFSEQPLARSIYYPEDTHFVPVNFNIAEPKELIFRLSVVAPGMAPEVICSATTKLEEISFKLNNSTIRRDSPITHFCYERAKEQEGGTFVAFDVVKVPDHPNRQKKRSQCLKKLNEVAEWIKQLGEQSKHVGNPLPRLLTYLLDASIDAGCLELSKKLLSMGADPSWAHERVQKYEEGVSQRDQNRKRVEDFTDESESLYSAKLLDESACSTVDPMGGFFLKLAPLLRKTAATDSTTDYFAPGIDLARDQNQPEEPSAPHRPPFPMPSNHRRHSATEANEINWTPPRPPDWENAKLPVLDQKWVSEDLNISSFCKFAPRCHHGFNCKYVHRVRCCASFKPSMYGSDLPLADEVFRRGLKVAHRISQGQEFWTARFCSRCRDRGILLEMYFSEEGDCRTNRQGIAWYRSENEAIAALRDRTILYRRIQHQFQPPPRLGKQK